MKFKTLVILLFITVCRIYSYELVILEEGDFQRNFFSNKIPSFNRYYADGHNIRDSITDEIIVNADDRILEIVFNDNYIAYRFGNLSSYATARIINLESNEIFDLDEIIGNPVSYTSTYRSLTLVDQKLYFSALNPETHQVDLKLLNLSTMEVHDIVSVINLDFSSLNTLSDEIIFSSVSPSRTDSMSFYALNINNDNFYPIYRENAQKIISINNCFYLVSKRIDSDLYRIELHNNGQSVQSFDIDTVGVVAMHGSTFLILFLENGEMKYRIYSIIE